MRRDELSLPLPPNNDRPGDRWMCGRSGEGCSRGPTVGGTCRWAEACKPRPTWHGQRRRITLVASIVMLLAITTVLVRRDEARVFKPGDLSTPHAQILAGTLASDRCASCHPQAATSPLQWFNASSPIHQTVSQSDRCLDCHHSTIDRSTAKLAHNLPRRTRAELGAMLRLASTSNQEPSWSDMLPGPAVDQENIECSVCHREHQGADGDLLVVSDTQCQTCHSVRFGSFATSHPDWQNWPYGRGGGISFNHATHAKKHYPSTIRGSEATEFRCLDCHERTSDNELTRSTSYARACQSCHDDTLRLEAAEGIDLLALPTLPADTEVGYQPWPLAATGFPDGLLSPIAELLMRSTPQWATAIRQLPQRDFSRIEEHDRETSDAVQTIADAHRTLMESIASDGHHAIVQRAQKLGVTESTLGPFVRSLPPQLIQDTFQMWFPGRGEESGNAIDPMRAHDKSHRVLTPQARPTSETAIENSAAEDDLLLAADDELLSGDEGSLLTPAEEPDDLLLEPLSGGNASPGLLAGSDPLLQTESMGRGVIDAGAGTKPRRFDADVMIPNGGWYRDDTRMAIRYRGAGHEDPVLKSTIELISQLSPSDPVRERLLGVRAIAACVVCHPGAVSSTGGWRADSTVGGSFATSREKTRHSTGFTKFSHGPHLNVARLANCRHCHAVATESKQVTLTSAGGLTEVHQFEPLGRQACAACHTPQAAGDACTKCHRYHIDLR